MGGERDTFILEGTLKQFMLNFCTLIWISRAAYVQAKFIIKET